jgi:hypothetical protein
MPARSFVAKFRHEFEAHAGGKGCPLKHGRAKELAAHA